MRLPSRSWLGALALAACQTQAEPEPELMGVGEPVDLQEWCVELDAPPLAALTAQNGALGPCGHFLGEGEQSVLIEPDGTHTAIAGQVWSPQFSATGHLVAWETGPDHSLALLDLRTGERRDFPGFDYRKWGFLRSYLPGRGAWLYWCDDDGLLVTAIDEDRIEIIADETWQTDFRSVCSDLVVASAGARLIFATGPGDIMLVDADAQTTRKIAGSFARYFEFGEDLDGDRLGRLIIHQVYGYEIVDDLGEYYKDKALIYRDDGSLLVELDGALKAVQGQDSGAPLFLSSNGPGLYGQTQVVVGLPEAPELKTILDASLFEAVVAADGTLLGSTNNDEVVLAPAATPDQPLRFSVDGSIETLALAPGASAAAWVDPTSECATDTCSHRITSVHRWSAKHGVAEPILAIGDAWISGLLDDGLILVHATPFTALIPEAELPQPSYLLIDVDGQVRAEFPGEWHVHVDVSLPDGRRLAWVGPSAAEATAFVLDEPSATLEEFGDPELTRGGRFAMLDGLGKRIAIVREAPAPVVWGALPD
jgi:hypothetical protein